MMAKESFLRGAKCSAVIKDVLTSIMRDYMEQNKPKPTPELYKSLLKYKKFRDKLSPEAHKQLQNLEEDGFSQLDITLMHKIARHFKSFYDPPTGRNWNADASPTEIEIGDDMARIRTARNYYAHCASVTVQQLEEFFRVFAEVGERFDRLLNKTENDSYEYRIRSYRQAEIGNFERYTFEVRVQPGNTLHVFVESSFCESENLCDKGMAFHGVIAGERSCIMTIFGIGNETAVADIINERMEKINEESKLIKLEGVTVGSLIFHLLFDSKLFSDHHLLFRELETIIQLLFTDLKYTDSTELYAVITHENDDEDTDDFDLSSDEDKEDRSLILDITAPPNVFESKDSMIQHFGNFVTAVSTNVNDQKVNWDRNIEAVIETRKEDYLHTKDCLHTEEHNFIRLYTLVLGVAPIAVRNLFDNEFSPDIEPILRSNQFKLQELHNKGVLSYKQLFSLFPVTGTVESYHFDVTLMICLLRHLSSIPEPNTGYERLPHQTDITQGADLARLKQCRDKLIHKTDLKLSTKKFQLFWDNASEAIKRLGNANVLQMCSNLQTASLDVINQKGKGPALPTIQEVKKILDINEIEFIRLKRAFELELVRFEEDQKDEEQKGQTDVVDNTATCKTVDAYNPGYLSSSVGSVVRVLSIEMQN